MIADFHPGSERLNACNGSIAGQCAAAPRMVALEPLADVHTGDEGPDANFQSTKRIVGINFSVDPALMLRVKLTQSSARAFLFTGRCRLWVAI